MNTAVFRKGATVADLIRVLQAYPQNATVVLASDEEGNDFGVCVKADQDSKEAVILWPASGTVELG